MSARARGAVAAAVLADSVGGILWVLQSAWMPGAPAGQAPLRKLDARAFEQLRSEFNAAQGAKLLVLLSPT